MLHRLPSKIVDSCKSVKIAGMAVKFLHDGTNRRLSWTNTRTC
jgi:hypothetical protein